MSELSVGPLPKRILLQARSDYLEGFNRLLDLRAGNCAFSIRISSELEMNSTNRVGRYALPSRKPHASHLSRAHDVEHVTKRCRD